MDPLCLDYVAVHQSVLPSIHPSTTTAAIMLHCMLYSTSALCLHLTRASTNHSGVLLCSVTPPAIDSWLFLRVLCPVYCMCTYECSCMCALLSLPACLLITLPLDLLSVLPTGCLHLPYAQWCQQECFFCFSASLAIIY